MTVVRFIKAIWRPYANHRNINYSYWFSYYLMCAVDNIATEQFCRTTRSNPFLNDDLVCF